MKFVFFLLIVFIDISGALGAKNSSDSDIGSLYAKCMKPAVAAKFKYWEKAQYQQFDGYKLNWNELTDAQRSEYRSRNLCIQDFMDVHLNCELYNCLRSLGQEERFVVISMNEELSGEKICAYLKSLDCVNDDVSIVRNFLSESGGIASQLFVSDMDEIISGIRVGNKPYDVYVDTDNEVCWQSDSGGDTLWHAFVDVEEKDVFASFASLCISLLDERSKEYFYEAAFYKKNNQGKSAVAIALDSGKIEYFSVFGRYFKQEGIDCQKLLDSVSKDIGVDKSRVSVLCPK